MAYDEYGQFYRPQSEVDQNSQTSIKNWNDFLNYSGAYGQGMQSGPTNPEMVGGLQAIQDALSPKYSLDEYRRQRDAMGAIPFIQSQMPHGLMAGFQSLGGIDYVKDQLGGLGKFLYGPGSTWGQDNPTQQPGGPQQGPAYGPSLQEALGGGGRTGMEGMMTGMGGGGSRAYQGLPMPQQAPQLQSQHSDLDALYAPILEMLSAPQPIKGPSTSERLADVLGAASGGALQGLNSVGSAGAVFGGAGAGASQAMKELRQEDQALQAEHQRLTMQMNHARAGVLGQKASSQMDLDKAMAETSNLQAQMDYNHKVQLSQMSQSHFTNLGNGMGMVESFDPLTGKGKMDVIETDPFVKVMQMAMLQSKLSKGQDSVGKNETYIIDGNEVKLNAIKNVLGGSQEFRSPLQYEAMEAALRAYADPAWRMKFSSEWEDYLKGAAQDNNAMAKAWDEQPEMGQLVLIYQTMLHDAGARAAIWHATGGVGTK